MAELKQSKDVKLEKILASLIEANKASLKDQNDIKKSLKILVANFTGKLNINTEAQASQAKRADKEEQVKQNSSTPTLQEKEQKQPAASGAVTPDIETPLDAERQLVADFEKTNELLSKLISINELGFRKLEQALKPEPEKYSRASATAPFRLNAMGASAGQASPASFMNWDLVGDRLAAAQIEAAKRTPQTETGGLDIFGSPGDKGGDRRPQKTTPQKRTPRSPAPVKRPKFEPKPRVPTPTPGPMQGPRVPVPTPGPTPTPTPGPTPTPTPGPTPTPTPGPTPTPTPGPTPTPTPGPTPTPTPGPTPTPTPGPTPTPTPGPTPTPTPGIPPLTPKSAGTAVGKALKTAGKVISSPVGKAVAAVGAGYAGYQLGGGEEVDYAKQEAEVQRKVIESDVASGKITPEQGEKELKKVKEQTEGKEAAAITGGISGGLVGWKGGALAGAAIGSAFFPVVGTAIGGAIGGALGAGAGAFLGSWGGSELYDAATATDEKVGMEKGVLLAGKKFSKGDTLTDEQLDDVFKGYQSGQVFPKFVRDQFRKQVGYLPGAPNKPPEKFTPKEYLEAKAFRKKVKGTRSSTQTEPKPVAGSREKSRTTEDFTISEKTFAEKDIKGFNEYNEFKKQKVQEYVKKGMDPAEAETMAKREAATRFRDKLQAAGAMTESSQEQKPEIESKPKPKPDMGSKASDAIGQPGQPPTGAIPKPKPDMGSRTATAIGPAAGTPGTSAPEAIPSAPGTFNFTPRERETLDFIAKREGATDPNTIYGDPKGKAGQGEFSKKLKEMGYTKPLTEMTVNEVLGMQKDLTKVTTGTLKHSPGMGTSAVGSGQMIRGTLISNLKALGIPEDQWDKIKFDKDLQDRLTLQNFKTSGIGDPNADPSTWNMTRLGKQYESLDTSKGYRAMTSQEMASIQNASGVLPAGTQVAGAGATGSPASAPAPIASSKPTPAPGPLASLSPSIETKPTSRQPISAMSPPIQMASFRPAPSRTFGEYINNTNNEINAARDESMMGGGSPTIISNVVNNSSGDSSGGIAMPPALPRMDSPLNRYQDRASAFMGIT